MHKTVDAGTHGDGANSSDDGSDTAHAYTGLRCRLLGAQRGELTRLHADGEIGDATRRRIQRQLDLEEAGLSDG